MSKQQIIALVVIGLGIGLFAWQLMDHISFSWQGKNATDPNDEPEEEPPVDNSHWLGPPFIL